MKLRKIVLFAMAALAFATIAWGGWHLSRSRTYQVFGNLVAHADTQERVVALTFDDGPTNIGVEFLLPVLQERNVKATFFLIGNALEKHLDLGARIVGAGHEIGNHSYTHQRMVLKSQRFYADELERTDRLIRDTGYEGPIHFRPPYGKKLLGLSWYLSRTNRTTIMWDVEPESYPEIAASSDQILEYVMRTVHPGSIIILHPMARSGVATREAIPIVIDALLADGYRFVTISQLLSLQSPNKSLQRAGTHKVLARGRANGSYLAPRPRAPTGRRAAAERSR